MMGKLKKYRLKPIANGFVADVRSAISYVKSASYAVGSPHLTGDGRDLIKHG